MVDQADATHGQTIDPIDKLVAAVTSLVATQKEQGARLDVFLEQMTERDERLAKEQAIRDTNLNARLEQMAERDEQRAREQAERDEQRAREQAIRDTNLNARLEQIAQRLDRSSRGSMVQSLLSPPLPPSRPSVPRFDISHLANQNQGTPTRQPGTRSSSSAVQSIETTTQKIQKKLVVASTAEYARLAQDNADNEDHGSIDDILTYLGADWKTAWDSAQNGTDEFSQANMDSVLVNYNARAESGRGTGYIPESKMQTRINALITAIKDMLIGVWRSEPELCWVDSHVNTIAASGRVARKPDGIFYVRKSGDSPQWPFVVVPVEVKSSKVSSEDSVLKGQLIWSYIDMAHNQPRRFVLGLSISKKGELHAQVCTPREVIVAWIGSLPTPSNSVMPISDAQKDAVRFLILLFKQLPKDYGYLVCKPRGIHERFKLSDIPGLLLDGVDEVHKSAAITIQKNTAKGGRREAITGPRSWVFPVKVVSPGAGKNNSKQAMLKFHWHHVGKSEAEIHRQVQALGVPYVPNLILASSIDDKDKHIGDTESICGEILIMEHAGERVSSLFLSSNNGTSVSRIADIFAGY
ncbi:hypothetical protein EV175_006089, partial [Coemansia sp. RSA 1933]